MFEKLKKRWQIETNFQLILIFIVFSVTGSAAIYVKGIIFQLLNINSETALWIKIPMYILTVFPAYQLLLIVIGTLFGQFNFFWNMEKKMWRRFQFKKRTKIVTLLVLIGFLSNSNKSMANTIEKVTLGGGCFWCTEAVYLGLNGVVEVKPGYSGGHVKSPSYNQVVTGSTGHAEVVQVTYDTSLVSFKEILEVFFATHDPTTLNRQGADIGTQYRSVIFYHTDQQKVLAEEIIAELNKEKVFDSPIVTEVTKFVDFYVAEDYHQNYFARNKNQPYCQFVVAPKVAKFEKIFKDKLKN